MWHPLLIGIMTVNTSLTVVYWAFILGDVYSRWLMEPEDKPKKTELNPPLPNLPNQTKVILQVDEKKVVLTELLLCNSHQNPKKERAEESFHVFTTDWMFGPKPVDDDSEGGGTENEEEERRSFSSKLMVKDELRMEAEKEGLLPGFHQGETGSRRPSTPPLRSAIALSYPGEKRISTHSVTFACPVNPYATSL